MDLNYYREFVTLMNIRSFTRAAEELYTTQSSLSKHIRSLENEWGVKLVDRNAREIKPTQAGEIVLKYAKTICASLNDCTAELNQFLNRTEEEIRIVGIRSMNEYGLEKRIFEFGAAHPQTRLFIENGSETKIASMVLEGTADIGFLREYHLDADSPLEKTLLVQDHISVILPQNHPLASRKNVSLKDLTGETFIRRQEDNTIQTIGENYVRAMGMELKYASLSIRTGLRNCLPYVEKGYGILLAPHYPARVDIEEGGYHLVQVDLEEEIPVNLCMISRKSDSDRPLSRQLMMWIMHSFLR